MFDRIQPYNHTFIPVLAYGFILLLAFSFTACTDKTIDHDKFIDAYVDLRIAEDTVRSDNYDIQKLQEEVFKKHGITEEQYNATFKYFNDNPERWEEFYKKAIARVDTLKKRMK
jgi:hypothetical protein